MPEPPVGAVSGGTGAMRPAVVALKRDVYDRYLEILSRAGYEQLARLGVDNAAEWNADRPGLSALAQQRTDELFDMTFKTARGRARTALLDELSKNLKPQDAAVQLRKRFRSVGRRQAYTAVATEVRDLVNLATLQAWQALGMTHVRASDGHGGLTGRTDPTCVARNGKVFPIDVALTMTTGHDPTVHPRCTLGWLPVVPQGGLSTRLSEPTGTAAAGSIIIPSGIRLALPEGAWIADKHPRWPAHTPGGKGGEFMEIGADFLHVLEAMVPSMGTGATLNVSQLAAGSHHISRVEVFSPHASGALLFRVFLFAPNGVQGDVGLAWLDGADMRTGDLLHALELADAAEPLQDIAAAIDRPGVATNVVADGGYRRYAQLVAPRNLPMRDLFTIPKTGKLRLLLDRVFPAIDKVHGHDSPPAAVEIPIRSDGEMVDEGAIRTYTGNGPLDMRISTKALHPDITVAHEIGHYIDRQVLGRDYFASDPSYIGISGDAVIRRPPELTAPTDPDVARVLHELELTDAATTLQAMMLGATDPVTVHRDGRAYPGIVPNRGYAEYNLHPWEMFARAYSQWIALRSGDPAMLRDVAEWQHGGGYAEHTLKRSGFHYPRQWEWNDFQGAAAALDDLFDHKGLLKPGARGADPAGVLKPKPLPETALPETVIYKIQGVVDATPGVLLQPRPEVDHAITIATDIRYDPRLTNEATNRDTHIVVGPKFFALSLQARRAVLAHEAGHYADSHYLATADSWVWNDLNWQDANGVPLGGPTATPGERIADAVAAALTGDTESLDRWPAIARIRADLHGILPAPAVSGSPDEPMNEIPGAWPERGMEWQRRWDALPDDQPVWLFHATTPEYADKLLREGSDPATKPRSLGRARYEAGEYAEFQPGAGLGSGLSVGRTPWDVSGYGHRLLAVQVPKGWVKVSREQAALGETSPGGALRVNDAVVDQPVPASAFREIETGGKVPGTEVFDQLTADAPSAGAPAPDARSAIQKHADRQLKDDAEKVAKARKAKVADYFAGAVSDPWHTPWIKDGIHITLVPSDWEKFPVEEIDPRGLYATQRKLLNHALDRHRDPAHVADDLPWVVQYKGRRWVLDGHHRVAIAVEQDRPTIRVHLLNMDTMER